MITEAERFAEIRERFDKHEPLNLSAVEIEAPWLLEGLFDPDRFVGWRECLEAAGVPVDRIRIEPLTGVTCRECGFEGETLWSHLGHAHGMSAADYLSAHPTAETSSEARRAEMMASRHGRPAKLIIPHWEPAWSRNYALDRIHHFSKVGIPLNYSHIAKHEPGFGAYVRRVFGSWDAGIAAAGLDAGTVRRARAAVSHASEEIVRLLREQEREKPSLLHIRAARSGPIKSLVSSAFRQFGSYEKALTAAGIDPAGKIPALSDKSKLRDRKNLLTEARARVKTRPPYDAAMAKDFIDRHAGTIQSFYGSWANFATSLGVFERDLFNSPSHTAYDSKKSCVAALRERARVGLSLRQNDVRTDNPSLEIMGEKHFGNHAKALEAANVQRAPRSIAIRDYTTGDAVIAELKRRHRTGESLHYTDLDRKGHRTLLKWSVRYFGSYPAALAAAGVPRPGKKPTPPAASPPSGKK